MIWQTSHFKQWNNKTKRAHNDLNSGHFKNYI